MDDFDIKVMAQEYSTLKNLSGRDWNNDITDSCAP